MKLLDQWQPPDWAGKPVACLATSFTFDADFFARDCLARFLRLTDAYGERDQIADVALMLEEEERLSEARVAVLVDRSCNPEPRNLRWDLLPVSVPGGLLHAKVALLVWEHTTRILLSSANLTHAGYRRQIEVGMAIDLEDRNMPRSVFVDLTAELRAIVNDLVPGDPAEPGPKQRALWIIDRLDERVATVDPPQTVKGARFAVGVSRPGASPIARFDDVWRGSPPQSLTALSPFWDGDGAQRGVRALLDKLASRSYGGTSTSATFVVPVETTFGGSNVVRAPRALQRAAPRRIDSKVCAFEAPAEDDRRLHAKCVLYESSNWIAAMVGSSNISTKGLGLAGEPHREINLWIGCRSDSPEARGLRQLVPIGSEISADDIWEPAVDEDEEPTPALPLGFAEAKLIDHQMLRLRLDTERLPQTWRVMLPAARSLPDAKLIDSDTWRHDGQPDETVVTLPTGAALPSGLAVRWRDDGAELGATWLVNVGDLTILPPPSELRTLPSSVLLAVLASTRPIREALEQELRRLSAQRDGHDSDDELDPLKRFDSSGFLLQRIRRASTAFWGLEQRLARPIPNVEALDWRLNGSIGPVTIANRLVEEAENAHQFVGETQFLLAELALTMSTVPWARLSRHLDDNEVVGRIGEGLDEIRRLSSRLSALGSIPDSVRDYAEAAFARSLA